MVAIALSQVFINLMSTGDYVAAYSQVGKTATASQDGEVRRYAGGRFRSIVTIGTRRTRQFTLLDVDQDTLDTLESWIGQTVLVRDNRGKRTFGTFFDLNEGDRFTNDRYNVSVSVTEVTYSEDMESEAVPVTYESWSGVFPQGNVTVSGSGTPQARRNDSGTMVQLRGRLYVPTTTQASNTVFAKLPVDHWPASERKISCRYTSGNGILTIASSGDMSFNNSVAPGAEVYLDGLEFSRDA